VFQHTYLDVSFEAFMVVMFQV